MTAPTPSPVTDEMLNRAIDTWMATPAEEPYRDAMRRAIAAALDGMVVVPREPTEAMINAANLNGAIGSDMEIASDYRAMVSVATPQAVQGKGPSA